MLPSVVVGGIERVGSCDVTFRLWGVTYHDFTLMKVRLFLGKITAIWDNIVKGNAIQIYFFKYFPPDLHEPDYL